LKVFRVFGLSSVDVEPSFKDGRFLLIPYEKSPLLDATKVVSTKSDIENFNHNLNWIKMMERWKTVCNNAEVFLYMDDDTELCPDAAHTLISSYFYALKHRYSWFSVRFTNTFSGMFWKCSEIGTLIERIKHHALKKGNTVSLETSFRIWWSSYLSYTTFKQLTFRYNLFKRISSGENQVHKCFEPNCTFDFSNDRFQCNFHF
jgi:hypothetical protein